MDGMSAVDAREVSMCCGGPAPKEAADACCLKDANEKAAGAKGCGCETPKPASGTGAAASCCS